ncbi:hypothetical protein DB48_07945 [Shewanella sp. cp20]|nr:hypothetical protein DB48_07945 [Shewanella sp. cp20]
MTSFEEKLDTATTLTSHGGVRHPLIKRSLMDGCSAKRLSSKLRGLTAKDCGNAVYEWNNKLPHCVSSFGLQVK